MFSDDGKAWSQVGVSVPADSNWRSVTYGTPGSPATGRFVAVATTGNNGVARSMWSDDGKAWTLSTTTATDVCPWRSVTYGGGQYVAVSGWSGTPSGSNCSNANATNHVMRSSDGKTWTTGDAANSNSWQGVAYGDGTYVAVSNSGTGTKLAMTSTDGISWTERTTPTQNFQSVAYGNGTFVAVGTGGSVASSGDKGVTWTTRTPASAIDWMNVTFANGRFVAVSGNATTASNRVMYSTDGITWTGAAASGDNQWWAVAFGKDLYASVSANGTTRAMYSNNIAFSIAANLDTGSSTVDACKTSACYVKSSGENVSPSGGSIASTTRQWQRCSILDDNSDLSCSNILNRNGAWYNASDSDIGFQVRVKTTMSTTLAGVLSSWSALSGIVRPVAVTAPAIVQGLTGGAPKRGTRVRSNFGTWQGYVAGVTTVLFQWQRCTGTAANTCSNISGATGQWYTPVTADLGNRLRVTATITTRGQVASASSSITGATT